jgi:hypothetical protein
MLIKILEFTKRGVVFTTIQRASLKNYVFLWQKGRRTVWISKQVYARLLQRLGRKKKFSYKKSTGHSGVTGIYYEIFRFPLYRILIPDEDKLIRLFRGLEKRYTAIRKHGKRFPAIRLGVSFVGKEKELDVFVNSKTHRKKQREVEDTISTQGIENKPENIKGMFVELYEKVYAYLFTAFGTPPMTLADDADIAAKYFYVFLSAA